MLRVENVKVYDLYESIVASGFAMLTDYNKEEIDKKISSLQSMNHSELMESKDLKRAIRLFNASKTSKDIKCHDNFLTGIRVSFDLIYPNYISPEMQRYHWFDIVTSSSKMHRITKMDFDKCCNKYVTQETKDNMKKYIAEYNSLFDDGNKPDSETYYKAFMKVISNCPQGVELFMRVSTNYKQLQTMYNQRKNHKLKEDWGAFCEFVESLPLSKELIIGDSE